ncbi:restriction endonuclease subunit S [Enterovibrio norvegicus]|uniref:restriction endonuclease subunit S n=1 Tax=Enterovibrio norvegicus TaxID=188144 RepID=UPI00352EA846
MSAEKLITDHIDIWTSAIKAKSASGRGSSKKRELYGIKKLRELILELAVRGKLVPQDSTDEPAPILYANLESDRNSWLESKAKENGEAKTMLRKLKKLTRPEQPFTLPDSWTCVHLIQLSRMLVDCHNKTAPYTEAGIPIIRTTNIRDRQFLEHDLKYVAAETYDFWSRRCPPEEGDIIFTREAPMGEATIIPPKAKWCLGQRTMLIRPMHQYVLNSYLLIALTEPHLLERASEHAVGLTVQHLRVGDVESLAVPLPPLQEQHRIVAKVDELMDLCDQLEQQTEASLDAHQVLVETLLATLTNSQDATELMANWARISEHFDTLFTTEQSIDQLKQTILQLAVMGKLVPQDPNDEPAAKLLERIAEEKTQLVKEKKIKKQKALPPIAEDEKPFELPNGWEWARFDDLINQQYPISYGVLVPGVEVDGGIPFVRIGDISIDSAPVLPEKTISKDVDAKYERTRLQGGEILMAVVGSIGKLGVAPDSWKGANIARALCRIVPVVEISKEFVLLLLRSEFMQSSFQGDTRTLAQPTLNVGLIKSSITPVPPVGEQHRISVKVDQLMTICDQLKQRLRHSQQTQFQLTDAIVEQAL